MRGTRTGPPRRARLAAALALGVALAAGAVGEAAASRRACPLSQPPPLRLSAAPPPDPAWLDDGVITAFALVEARPEQVWAVLTDFEIWPELFEEIQRVDVEPLGDGIVSLHQASRRFGWAVEYTAVSTLRPEQGRIEIRLNRDAPADIADLHSLWEVRPTEGGRATRVALHLRLDSGLPIPRWMERRMLERSVHDSVRGVASATLERCPGPPADAPAGGVAAR